jgi:prevent-host-death family protein
MPMRTINIHQAKTQLSKLVEEAAKDEPFVIAKAGKPMVKVTALETPVGKKMQRFGFMKDIGSSIPDDFDRMFDAEIEELFGLHEANSGEATRD